MKPGKPKKTPIALNLPKVVALLLVFVRHVIDMMTKNVATFASPNPQLSTVAQHADDLEAAEVTAKTLAKGAAQVRNDKKRVVEDDMALLKAYVYSIAAANPALAITIILAAGMSPKNFRLHVKPQLEAIMVPFSLEVLLRARAEQKKAFYEWQYSADGGHTWVDVRTTNAASTMIKGLTAGVTYQFRYRATVKQVTGDWSQVVSLLVH
jgi:hypothetical protein